MLFAYLSRTKALGEKRRHSPIVSSVQRMLLPLSSSTTKEYTRTSEDDDALMVDLPSQGFVRAVVEDDGYDAVGYQEVILDSGADCTVLPFGMFSDVGGFGPSLRDAQGNEIPQSTGRVGVKFEIGPWGPQVMACVWSELGWLFLFIGQRIP